MHLLLISQLEKGEQQVLLSLHDFFREDELKYFLENFTKPAPPLTHRNVGFSWTDTTFDWPRTLVIDKQLGYMPGREDSKGIRITNVVRRWDLINKVNYLEDGWNGLYKIKMFEKIPEGSTRTARNFESLLRADGPETDASNYNFTGWANQLEIEPVEKAEQENPNLAGKMINWIYCIGTEYWSERIPNIEDPIWRKERFITINVFVTRDASNLKS